MDNVHGAHGTASIVKDPFLVEIDISSGQLLAELVDNVLDDLGGVVAVRCNGTLGQIVQVDRVKDVKGLEMRLEKVKESGQQRNSGGKDGQWARHGSRCQRACVSRREEVGLGKFCALYSLREIG